MSRGRYTIVIRCSASQVISLNDEAHSMSMLVLEAFADNVVQSGHIYISA